ncbi:MAG: uracil phosphoribosyltransferase [Candidatus Dormibacteria bacterium]
MAPQANVVDHPTVAHLLSELRSESTDRDRFRQVMADLTGFLAYEALHDLATEERPIRTPVAPARARRVAETVLVVPVLRAGLGMVPGVERVVPNCDVAHLGMKRDERTLAAVCYLDGLPADLRGRLVVVCDPMLATGGSLAQACRLILDRGPARVVALCLVASEPGLARFAAQLPQVAVVCAAVDSRLDERGYIVPGLGDAGDRLFGPPGEGLGAEPSARDPGRGDLLAAQTTPS